MLNKEALKAVLSDFPVNDLAMQKAMFDAGIGPDETYAGAAGMKDIDLCAVAVLKGLLAAPDVKEGGYSVTFDRKHVFARITGLESANGVESAGKPAIRDKSSIW